MRERARIADLHCHDLRLELGSRLRETPGMPDYELRDWLRHANIATTDPVSVYDACGCAWCARRFEEARNIRTSFVPTRT